MQTNQWFLLTGFLAFGLTVVPGPSAAGNGACERLLGEWKWFDSGTVTFTSDGKAAWRNPLTGEVGHTANWQCDTGTGTATVTIPWTNGFTDVMNLSQDGQNLQGRNNRGMTIGALRPLASAADGVALKTVDLGAQRIPKDLPALAKATIRAAKRWHRDAVLVGVRLREEGRLKPGAFFVQLMFYSPAVGTGLWMNVHETGTDTLESGKVSWSTLPIPEGFIDLPEAIATARNSNLQGLLKQAWLRVEEPKDRPAVLAWRITAEGQGMKIDASSGAVIDYDVTDFAEYVKDYNQRWQHAAEGLRRLMGSGAGSVSTGSSSSSACETAGGQAGTLDTCWGTNGRFDPYTQYNDGRPKP